MMCVMVAVVVIVRGRPSTRRVVAAVPADAAFLWDVSEEEGIVVVLFATGKIGGGGV